MKFLSFTGLEHFWSRIKSYLQPTQETVKDLAEEIMQARTDQCQGEPYDTLSDHLRNIDEAVDIVTALNRQNVLKIISNLNLNNAGVKVSQQLRSLIADYQGADIMRCISEYGETEFIESLKTVADSFSEARNELPFYADGFSITVNGSMYPLDGHRYSGSITSTSAGMDLLLWKRFNAGIPHMLMVPTYTTLAPDKPKHWVPAYMHRLSIPETSATSHVIHVYEYKTPPIKANATGSAYVSVLFRITVNNGTLTWEREYETIAA